MTTSTQHTSQTDLWHIDTVDVDEYLERIDHPRVAPSADALRSLHEAHVRAIPFENIDVVLGTHPGIGLDAVTDKLVHRRRGGYCYEHALLFAAVLEQLGFPVQRRIARVQPHRAGPYTHMLLAVHSDGEDYLADVGFGAGMMYPMPLRHGVEVDQAGWPHRLTYDGSLWTLSKRTADGWEPQHASGESPQYPVDYEVAHHYTNTHPHSPFTSQLIVMRLDHGISRRLVGNKLTIEHSDGNVEQSVVAPVELGTTLHWLDIPLDDAQLAALHRVS